MLYIIDGYNLLFRLFHSEKKFETQRNLVIEFLNEKASSLNLNINLIFDGHQTDQNLSNRSYYDRLKVIYTPKDQTADDYILEMIFFSKSPSGIIVISSDKALETEAKNMKAQTQSIDAFIDSLAIQERKVKKSKKIKEEFVDTKKDIQRLLKIFEKKIKEGIEDWD